MTWLWIPITLFASFCQAIRTALQKSLAKHLSVMASAFVRFAYGAPFALIYLMALAAFTHIDLPFPNARFMIWVMMGSVAQIWATALLLHVLSLKNFPVGIAYTKTEILQVAVFGLVFLGDQLTFYGTIAIFLGTIGIMIFSMSKGSLSLSTLLTSWLEKPALLGMLSGGFFGLSAIGFRGASLASGLDSPFIAASYALAFSTIIQTILMALYLTLRERGQWKKLRLAWQPSLYAGMSSVLGSAGWFTAMTLQKVAYVRTLALIELLFTFAISIFWFREKTSKLEIIGIACLIIAVGMVLNS